MSKLIRAVTLAVALTVVLSLGVAAQTDVYSERTMQLSRQLECPVCAGLSVADSTSQLAGQMRAIIEEKVQAGETDQQITDYFVARYGQEILREPPKSGFSLGLWWMPVVVVLLGGVVVLTFLREKVRPATTSQSATATSSKQLDAEVADVLNADES